MNYIDIKDLKKGEFYQTCSSNGEENMFIFVCGEDGKNIFSKGICLHHKTYVGKNTQFGTEAADMRNKIQLASPENRLKLEACIKAGTFIEINDIVYEIY